MAVKTTLAFVDAIEDEVARLLVGEEAFTVSRALLPAEAAEGSWLRLGVEVVPSPPDDTEARRRKLGEGDPGGDIEL
jgi:hypothetical protein